MKRFHGTEKIFIIRRENTLSASVCLALFSPDIKQTMAVKGLMYLFFRSVLPFCVQATILGECCVQG